jgi:hypothetical protein
LRRAAETARQSACDVAAAEGVARIRQSHPLRFDLCTKRWNQTVSSVPLARLAKRRFSRETWKTHRISLLDTIFADEKLRHKKIVGCAPTSRGFYVAADVLFQPVDG